MISSYNSDKLIYEQYKDSDDEEKQNWAEQAKMRANKTANTYNNYILKMIIYGRITFLLIYIENCHTLIKRWED